MPALLIDFHDPSAAAASLKQVAKLMAQAGQFVVETNYDARIRRTASVSYREALLTLASGQVVTLRVTQTGDVFQVLLNRSLLPIKAHDDPAKALAEVAAAAEANQEKFQRQLARKAMELPPSVRTAAPNLQKQLTEQLQQLDTQISGKQATVAELEAKLKADGILDSVRAVIEDPRAADANDSTTVVVELDGNVQPGEVDRLCSLANIPEGYSLRIPAKSVIDLPRAADSNQSVRVVVGEPGGPAQFDTMGTFTGGNELALAAEVTGSLDAVVQAQALAARVSQGLLDGIDVAAAITTLQLAKEVVDTNAPINEARGDTAQAELERANSASFGQALELLAASQDEAGDDDATDDGDYADSADQGAFALDE